MSLKQFLNSSILVFKLAVFPPVDFSNPSLTELIIFSDVIIPETISNFITAKSLLLIISLALDDFFGKYNEPTYKSNQYFSRTPAPFKDKLCPSTVILLSNFTPETTSWALTDVSKENATNNIAKT